jgi:molybdenum cofactor cytidylyltransferase
MSVASILLAAGQSRRMGAFKPLLPFGDKTVIEACVEYLRGGGAEQIVVVLGHRAADVRERIKHLHVSFAVNPDPASEMSASVECGVRSLTEDASAILIAPVDHAGVPAGVVRLLIDEWKRTGQRLIVPTYEGRGGHPVLIDGSLRQELLTLDQQRGLRALFAAHRDEVRRMPVASPYVARDMDTWDDYRALHEEVFGITPPDPS